MVLTAWGTQGDGLPVQVATRLLRQVITSSEFLGCFPEVVVATLDKGFADKVRQELVRSREILPVEERDPRPEDRSKGERREFTSGAKDKAGGSAGQGKEKGPRPERGDPDEKVRRSGGQEQGPPCSSPFPAPPRAAQRDDDSTEDLSLIHI